MEMPIRGTIVKRIDGIKKPAGVSNRTFGEAMAEVAAGIELELQEKLSKPYPPPSRVGGYPKRRTGELVESVNVTGTEKGITISSVVHGAYLNAPKTATNTAGGRPWAERAASKAKVKRYQQRVRTLSKQIDKDKKGRQRGRS